MISKAVFAGTFDPFTLGHFEIAERTSKRFDEVIVAVADVTGKMYVSARKTRKTCRKIAFHAEKRRS